MSNFRCPHC